MVPEAVDLESLYVQTSPDCPVSYLVKVKAIIKGSFVDIVVPSAYDFVVAIRENGVWLSFG